MSAELLTHYLRIFVPPAARDVRDKARGREETGGTDGKQRKQDGDGEGEHNRARHRAYGGAGGEESCDFSVVFHACAPLNTSAVVKSLIKLLEICREGEQTSNSI